jgi:hypothetical protein
LRFGPLLGHSRLATQEVEERGKAQGLLQGKGVAELLGVCEGCLAPLPRLVWIPQQPQGHGAKEAAENARVLAVPHDVVLHLLRIILGQRVLHMGMSQGELPLPKRDIPLRPVGLHEQNGVVQLLGYAEEFLPHLVRPLRLPSHLMHIPQPPQHREELWCVPHLLAELACASINAFYLQGVSPEVYQRWAQRNLQTQFPLGTRGGVRQGAEHRKPLREVRHRFQYGRAFEGTLARLLPVADGLCQQARLGMVVRQEFGLGRYGFGELGLQHLRNALVILLPCALEKRLICRILYQGMLKEVGRLGEETALVEQFGLDELCQSMLQGRFVQRRHGP